MATDTQETQVVRDKGGKWIVAPKSPAPITHENARSMVQKRWDKYRQAAVRRIVGEAKSIDPTVSTGADAFGMVAAKQYSALMDSEKPVIGDLEKLQRMMTGQQNSERENARTAPQNAISVPPAALLELAAQLEAEIAASVQRARAVDGVVDQADIIDASATIPIQLHDTETGENDGKL